MNTSTDKPHSADARQLEREIDQKRDYIGDLVGALESRLSPGELFERVLGSSKGNGGEFARNLGNVVKANPVPALLVSAGLVWLYASRNETTASLPNAHLRSTYASSGSEVSSYGSSAEEGAFGDRPYQGSTYGAAGGESSTATLRDRAASIRDDAREKLHDVKSRMGESVHDASSRVGDTLHGATGALAQRAQQARGGFENMLQDNPMAAGAIAIAVGALLGAVVPTTEKENRLMGELGDKVTGKAKAAASTVYAKSADTVRELGTRVKSSATSGSATGDPAGTDAAGNGDWATGSGESSTMGGTSQGSGSLTG